MRNRGLIVLLAIGVSVQAVAPQLSFMLACSRTETKQETTFFDGEC